jgi:hypothetical protein
MGTAEEEALAAVSQPGGNANAEEYLEEYRRRLAERQEGLRRSAQATARAMQGWEGVESPAHWKRIVQQADDDVDSRAFLIDRLGADRHLDPVMTAVLLALRNRLIEEYRVTTAAELMIVDAAVISHYHFLRLNAAIGNITGWLESEFFGLDHLTAATGGNDPRKVEQVRGLRVEELVGQLVDKLMPMLERTNKMMLRNLQALRDQRRGPVPQVSIGSAGQVNVAAVQQNSQAEPND